MKVALLSTFSKSGGAAIACQRLLKALKKRPDIDATMYTGQPSVTENVKNMFPTIIGNIKKWLLFIIERIYFIPFEKSAKVRYLFSPAISGVDPLSINSIKHSDILHIHWFNQGLLSLRSLSILKKSGKPVIFTMHDMWMMTGGCHYTGTCRNFENACGNCPFLKDPADKDLSRKIWKRKYRIFDNWDFTLVTCSNWLKEEALKSSLLGDKNIVVIPNPIDTEFFSMKPRNQARLSIGLSTEKFYILFGAMNIDDERKGFKYLKSAIDKIGKLSDVELLIFGKADETIFENFAVPVNYMGQISKQENLVTLYNSADVFLLPSLEDNLPNTVMEAASCGTPTVAFDIGGLRDLVEQNVTGYLAKEKSPDDLANGIQIIWDNVKKDPDYFRANTREKVINCFSETKVASSYISLYEKLAN